MEENKLMFRVDKFIPAECPNCDHAFKEADYDWVIMWRNIKTGRLLQMNGDYMVIHCQHCGNQTIMVILESYILFDPEKARKLLNQGFVSFYRVYIPDSKAKNQRIVYAEIKRQKRIEILKIDI